MKIKVETGENISVFTNNKAKRTSGGSEVRQKSTNSAQSTSNAGSSAASIPFKVKQEPTELPHNKDSNPRTEAVEERKWYSKRPLASPVQFRGCNAVKKKRSPKIATSTQHSQAQEQQPIPIRTTNQNSRYEQQWHPRRVTWRANHLVWRPPYANQWERPCVPNFSGPPQCIGPQPGASCKSKKKKKRPKKHQAQPATSKTVPPFASTSTYEAPSVTNETPSQQPHDQVSQRESCSKKRQRSEMHTKDDAQPGPSSNVAATVEAVSEQPLKKKTKQGAAPSRPLTSQGVREKALEKLRAAQFRLLNEEMYLTSGSQAEQAFKEDPQAFKYYHAGFQKQVEKWPVNPVDIIIEELKKMPKVTVIADMGCGNAKIAQSLQKRVVHSFDLVALNNRVTQCDMSNVPLESSTVDVVVFCLSLMGTNLSSFILEANRILKTEGTLKVAEVESRFSSVESFIEALKKFGFALKSQNGSYKMFILFEFKKMQDVRQNPELPVLELKPCLYKKR